MGSIGAILIIVGIFLFAFGFFAIVLPSMNQARPFEFSEPTRNLLIGIIIAGIGLALIAIGLLYLKK